MAWWTHLLFFKARLEEEPAEDRTHESVFASFRRAMDEHMREHVIDILYFTFTIFTYLYFLLSVVTFLFEDSVPPLFPNAIEVLSEPYLGVLGIYVVVKEVERRRGKVKPRTWSELFAVMWIVFLAAATGLTFYSEHYAVSETYKTIVTNALAALIIRLGTILR